LLGTGFQRRTFHFLWVPELSLASSTSCNSHLKSESKSKLCYDRWSVGQSVSLSSTHLEHKTRFYYCQRVAGLLMWGTVCDERTSLSFTIAAGPRQHSHSRVRVPRNSWPYFAVSDSRIPHPGGLGPRIYIPQEWGGPVIPPGTGFPFHRLLRLAGQRWRYWNPHPCRVKANNSESESESELLYDWRFTANQFVLAPSPLRITTRDFLFLNWTQLCEQATVQRPLLGKGFGERVHKAVSDGSYIVACSHSCYKAMGIHVTMWIFELQK
jgi:hypothetical protein